MEDLNDKITGGSLAAIEWNQVPSEIQNVIEGLGISLSSGDLNQLGKAISGYVANGQFYTDSGIADAYVLSVVGLKQSSTAYATGFKISFVAGNTNTGASTVNVATLGVKTLKTPEGNNIASGIIKSGTLIEAFFDGTDFIITTPSFITLSIGNVLGFGAIGDNTVDDLTAFNNALAKHTNLVIPPRTYRVSALPDFSAGHSLIANGATLVIDSGFHTSNNINLLNPGGLIIKGKTVESITLDALTSVTGTAGDYTVVGTVSDGSKVAVGDVMRVKDVEPGIIAPGSIPSTRPALGELRLGFFQMGLLSTVGTAATISGTGVNTFLAQDDLMILKGEVVKITSISDDSNFVISKALTQDISGHQYWFYFDNRAAGLATTSGTTVTITSPVFDNNLNVGSLIGVADGGIRRVVSITNDMECEVDIAFPTVASKSWGVVDFGEMHEGAWVVTNVVSNTVTWTNTSRTVQGKPPLLNFDTANIDVYKTQLQFTGSGLSAKQGVIELQDIALKGDTTGRGIEQVAAATDPKGGKVVVNTNFAVVNFQYGVWNNQGSVFFGEEAQICNNSFRGVNTTEGGTCWLQKATINGNDGIGILIGPGSFARMADARCNGNNTDGMRMEVGGSAWADFAYFQNNGQNGVLGVGGMNVHLVGGRFNSNGDDGIDGQNGIYGRATGAMAISNGNAGIRVATGQLEANQSNTIGNATFGVVANGGHMKLNDAGSSGNSTSNVRLEETAHVNGDGLHTTDSVVGITSQNESTFAGLSVGFGGNTTDDCNISSGGKISLDSANITPSANVALNVQTAQFGYVADF